MSANLNTIVSGVTVVIERIGETKLKDSPMSIAAAAAIAFIYLTGNTICDDPDKVFKLVRFDPETNKVVVRRKER